MHVLIHYCNNDDMVMADQHVIQAYTYRSVFLLMGLLIVYSILYIDVSMTYKILCKGSHLAVDRLPEMYGPQQCI